jgi:hypothetical protein
MRAAGYERKCCVSEDAKSNVGQVRVFPVDAVCSERQFVSDLSFMDYAAKVPEEPTLTNAAGGTNGRFFGAAR